ncbi:uncharacterized protein LOC123294125 [Chrysoperla carnea]|uniref:uncharacterized protein LOC123294125 n=1 Tax=Chrysoperla carnea TaxID=189513 RepID=UPI001D072045|nr:uncharacterized protein LOC123294125 [Chrysoperla carnea]
MIKFVLSIFIITSYLNFYSAQHNNGYFTQLGQLGTAIEYSVAPIIDIVTKPLCSGSRSNLQNTAKINGYHKNVISSGNQNYNTNRYNQGNPIQNKQIQNIRGQNVGKKVPNGQAGSRQNPIYGVGQNRNSKTYQNQNGISGRQTQNGQTWHRQNQNSSTGQIQNYRTGQNQNNEVNGTQIPIEQIWSNQNQSTEFIAKQIPNRQTKQSQNSNINHSKVTVEQITNQQTQRQNQNTAINRRQFSNGQTLHVEPSQNSGLGQNSNYKTAHNQNNGVNTRQISNIQITGQTWYKQNQNYATGQNQNSRTDPNRNTAEQVLTGQPFHKQNQNSGINQSQNSRPVQKQNTGNNAGQVLTEHIFYKENQNSDINQSQNSRPVQKQNTGNNAGQVLTGHKFHKQNQNYASGQNQNFRTYQNRNTGNTAEKVLTGQPFHKQNQNSGINQSQIFRSSQNQNAGNSAGQAWQDQNQNSKTDLNQNTKIVSSTEDNIEPYVVLGSQSTSAQLSYNFSKYPNPYYMQQNQNTKSDHSQNNEIATGQTNQNCDHNSGIGQNQSKGFTTGQVPNGQTWQHQNRNSETENKNIRIESNGNDNIEPTAILGKQSTSVHLPYDHKKYPNYFSQQNQLNEQLDNENKQGDNIVVTNNPYCTQIARELIEKGGNVREVFIAASLCEGLVHPMDSGIGGGFQAVYYNFENNHPNSIFIDSREKSPGSSKFTKSSTKIGGNSIAIPSVLAGYEAVYNIDKHNNLLQWPEIIQPVLNLCQNGYYMSKPTKAMIELIVRSNNRTQVQINKLTIPKYCDTLTQIKSDGPSSSMYRANGHLHKLLLQDLRSVKSTITSRDIENYKVGIIQPAVTRFEKYTVYSTKAPGSGQAILFALKIIERLRKVIPSKATVDEKIVYLLKILKYTYTLKPHLREISENEINKIINGASQSLAEGIVQAGFKLQNTIPTKFGDVTLPKLQTSPSRGTTNIVIKIGKSAITASSSIGSLFGSGIFSETMGFCYNSHLRDFSNPNWRRNGKPLKNIAGPNKVTSSTISPVIMVDDSTGEPVFQIGSAGGSHILSAIVNTCFNYFILNRSLKDSVAACRIMPKLNYSRNEVIYSYECIDNERSFFNNNTAKRLRSIGVVFKYGKTAGYAAVTSLSKLRDGYPEAVFDNRRGGSSFIE